MRGKPTVDCLLPANLDLNWFLFVRMTRLETNIVGAANSVTYKHTRLNHEICIRSRRGSLIRSKYFTLNFFLGKAVKTYRSQGIKGNLSDRKSMVRWLLSGAKLNDFQRLL